MFRLIFLCPKSVPRDPCPGKPPGDFPGQWKIATNWYEARHLNRIGRKTLFELWIFFRNLFS
jgi:hypothetical protein